jgi:hypothetical protein
MDYGKMTLHDKGKEKGSQQHFRDCFIVMALEIKQRIGKESKCTVSLVIH